MGKKRKDTDYVYLSTRVKAMERGLLDRARAERVLAAPTEEAAARVLQECGYPDLAGVTGRALEAALAQRQREMLEDLAGDLPDRTVLDLFRAQVDYHNAKVLVKAQALGTDPTRLLLVGGRYPPGRLAANGQKGKLSGYSQRFRRAVEEGREVLDATGDPQQVDFTLDRAYFEEAMELAIRTGSKCLTGYVAVLIDTANLRTAVRASRLGKGTEFLWQALVPGGTVSPSALARAGGGDLARLFRGGPLAAAAAAGAAATDPGSGPLTEFERLCGEAVAAYWDESPRVPFGVEPVAAYLHARQGETAAIRTILAGRRAGMDGEAIRLRLGRQYR